MKYRKLMITAAAAGLALMSMIPVYAAGNATSEYWYQEGNNWKIKDGSGKAVTDSWVCDDKNNHNQDSNWYLLDSTGKMYEGVINDNGHYYLLDPNHNGTYGMMISGASSYSYNGVTLQLETAHNGFFGEIKNTGAVSSLGLSVTKVNTSGKPNLYTSQFGGGNQQNNAAGKNISQILTNGDAVHQYYTNVSAEGRAKADAICKQYADSILSNSSYKTDKDKVEAATKIVAAQCQKITYNRDANKYYRSPYGVFVSGNYTCAGATRALGRILEYMGYSWNHLNENDEDHQWCEVEMDGRVGWADGMGGQVGFGAHDQFGLNYDINPNGNFTASNASNPEKLAAARKNGGDLLYYYYVPYAFSKVPENRLASYNLDDVEPANPFHYTFRPDNTVVMHAHPENEACRPAPSATDPGDIVLTKCGEGTQGGVHYVEYTKTDSYHSDGSVMFPQPETITRVEKDRFYDSGILVSAYTFIHSSNGQKMNQVVTTALR